jgi:hypothetical protein
MFINNNNLKQKKIVQLLNLIFIYFFKKTKTQRYLIYRIKIELTMD